MKKQNTNHRPKADHIEISCECLKANIALRVNKPDRIETEIPGLALFRREETTSPLSVMYEPSICLIVQGGKSVTLGDYTFKYDARNYLLTSIDLPAVVQITVASVEKPLLGLMLKIDFREVSQLMVDSNLPPPRAQSSNAGMVTGEVTLPLMSAFQRLVSLLDEPQDIPILAPIIHREICYRVLVGDQGARLRQMAFAGSQSQHVAKAIEWLKEHYSEKLRVKDLAALVNMSTSTFHSHFRALTTMTPLQYQKWLRLNEARRLMLAENLDAANAAFEVGYKSPSQFSREYSRLFGSPPFRDIKNLHRITLSEIG